MLPYSVDERLGHGVCHLMDLCISDTIKPFDTITKHDSATECSQLKMLLLTNQLAFR